MVDLGHVSSHLITDDSSERYPGCRASERTRSLHGLCGPWAGVCVCVCVCDGHTFAKGPQGEIRTFSPGGAWATGECASPPDGVPAACHRMRGFLVMGVLPSWEETVGNDF